MISAEQCQLYHDYLHLSNLSISNSLDAINEVTVIETTIPDELSTISAYGNNIRIDLSAFNIYLTNEYGSLIDFIVDNGIIIYQDIADFYAMDGVIIPETNIIP